MATALYVKCEAVALTLAFAHPCALQAFVHKTRVISFNEAASDGKVEADCASIKAPGVVQVCQHCCSDPGVDRALTSRGRGTTGEVGRCW